MRKRIRTTEEIEHLQRESMIGFLNAKYSIEEARKRAVQQVAKLLVETTTPERISLHLLRQHPIRERQARVRIPPPYNLVQPTPLVEGWDE